MLSEYPDEDLEFLIENETKNYALSVDLFPTDMRRDLSSELRGRSILILIEIAYQYPKHSYVGFISESLKLPQSTISYEIKKLIFLQYIQPVINLSTLQDSRFKYFSLTPKGITFLHLLKESISLGIVKLKNNEFTSN